MGALTQWNLTLSPAFVVRHMGDSRAARVIIPRLEHAVKAFVRSAQQVKFWSIRGKGLTKSMRACRQGLEEYVVLVDLFVGRLLFVNIGTSRSGLR